MTAARSRRATVALGLACGLGIAGCSAAPEIPVRGAAFGQQLDTTVDSEIARYYLERYLPRQHGDDRQLRERIAALEHRYERALPSREELKAISEEFSVDFAAAFLADRLMADACNRALADAFARHLHDDTTPLANPSRYLVLFVPGWDYVENGAVTGADFGEPRRLVRSLGVESRLVELPPTAGVEQNARVVADTLAEAAGSGKTILLAGASSAGPAIHLALGELAGERERRAVKAWLNLGGILQGSPLVDYLQRWPQRWVFAAVAWLKDWKREDVLSMSAAASRARFQRLRVDPDTLVINYLGVPLSGQVTRFSSDKYPLLRAEGPNDGLTLLTDALAPNSLTIVAFGSDHFFAEDPRINPKTVALLKLIVGAVENPALLPRNCTRA